MINDTYATVPLPIRKPKSKPLTSDIKKSIKRYPLIRITRTAIVHASLYNINEQNIRYRKNDAKVYINWESSFI
jgi:hypothetical protein